LQLELRPRGGNDLHADLHFRLLNEGRGLARHAGFTCRPANAVIAGVYGHGLQDMTVRNNGIPTIAFYDPHTVVHANGIYFDAGHAILLPIQGSTSLGVAVTWYAENMETREATSVLRPGELALVH
jgi:hypothetical protein